MVTRQLTTWIVVTPSEIGNSKGLSGDATHAKMIRIKAVGMTTRSRKGVKEKPPVSAVEAAVVGPACHPKGRPKSGCSFHFACVLVSFLNLYCISEGQERKNVSVLRSRGATQLT